MENANLDQGVYLPPTPVDNGLSQKISDFEFRPAPFQTGTEFAQSIATPGASISDLINQIETYNSQSAALLQQGSGFNANVDLSFGSGGFNPDKAFQAVSLAANPSTPTLQASAAPTYLGTVEGFNRFKDSENFQAFGYNQALGAEQEYRYGRAMSWGDTIGNALGGGSALAAETFVEAWKGWGRMAEALFTLDASKLMGSAEERLAIAERQQQIMDKYAIYNTEQSEDSVWNRQFFGNMLQQSGFAVGAGLQFAMESFLTAGVGRLFSGLGKAASLAKGIETAGELVNDARKVMNTVTRNERVVSSIGNAAKKLVPMAETGEQLFKMHRAGAGLMQLGLTGLGGIKKELSLFNMARSEAIFEAAGTYKSLKDRLTNEFIEKNGRIPSSSELERINQTAEDASHDNFYTNVGVLSVMNRIQFDNLSRSFSGTRKLFNDQVTNLADEAFQISGKIGGKEATRVFQKGTLGSFSATGDIARTFGRKTAAWEATKSIGRGLLKFEGSEGAQELLQEASSEGLGQYYYDLHHGKKGFTDKLDATLSSIKNPVSDIEGMKTFLMGALTGRLIAPLSAGLSQLTDRAAIKDRRTKAAESIATLNAFYSDPAQVKREAIANVKVQNKAAETMEQAVRNRDRYVFQNTKDSAFAKAVASAIKLNMFESMRDSLRELGQDMTSEEFRQNFEMEATTENRKSVTELFQGMARQVEDYHTTYQALKDKYSDRILPELYRNNDPQEYKLARRMKMAVDDAIEILTTNLYKSRQALTRAAQLQGEIAANRNIGSSSVEVLTKMGSEQAIKDHIQMLSMEIASYQASETLSKEQRDILKDKQAELAMAIKWQLAYRDLEDNTDASYSPSAEDRAYRSFADMVNLFNKRSGLDTTISRDDVEENYIKLADYIRLNRDYRSYIDAMNMLADPSNLKLVAQSMMSGMEVMEEKFKAEHQQEIEKAAEDPEPVAVAEAEVTEPEAIQPAGNNDPVIIPANTKTPEEEELNTDGPAVNLFDYLLDIYKGLAEEPGFNLSFKAWKDSGAADPFIQQYNETYSKNEPLVGKVNTQGRDAVDQLNLKGATKATIGKAIEAVKKVYEQVKDVPALMDKLLQKVASIQDEYVRTTLNALLRPAPSGTESPYIPLINKGVFINTPEHPAFDMVNISGDELQTGFNLRGMQEVGKYLAGGLAEINGKINVKATTAFYDKSQQQVQQAAIPGRTLMTYETPRDIASLKRGNPVIAVSSSHAGFDIQIFAKGLGQDKNLYVKGIGDYAIVYPDNRTEALTFSDDQKAIVQKAMLLDGNAVSDEKYKELQQQYKALEAFRSEVRTAMNLTGEKELDVTPIYNKYFNLTKKGYTATKGEALEELLKDNPQWMFTVSVQDEDGVITEKPLPLFAYRKGTTWVLDMPVQPGETLVEQEEDRTYTPVADLQQYLKTQLGIDPVFSEQMAGVVALVANAPDAGRGYKPYVLDRMKGTEPVALFRDFAGEFIKLQEAIKQGSVLSGYKYDGKQFPRLDMLMKHFNINKFGFYRYNEWIINLGYNDKTGGFLFELRPYNKEKRFTLTSEQKALLNIYFDPSVITSSSDAADDALVGNYKKLIQNITEGLRKSNDKMVASPDPVVKELLSKMDSRAFFYYETDGDKKTWLLKLTDKRKPNVYIPLLKWNSAESTASIKMTLKDIPQVVSPAPAAPAGFTVMGTLNGSDDEVLPDDVEAVDFEQEDGSAAGSTTSTEVASNGRTVFEIDDEDDPFMLAGEEDLQRYTETTFNKEAAWLGQALKGSGVQLRELSTILSKLDAGKEVLGYYKDQAIYVDSMLSAEGTIYHEAFHALFRDILSVPERRNYLDKAIRALGKIKLSDVEQFRRDRKLTLKTNEEIIDLMGEEYLAEGFRAYKLRGEKPKQGWLQKLVQIIERIVNFFKGNSGSIEQLYSGFDSGAYSGRALQATGRNDEGAYALAYGRPRMREAVDKQGNIGYGYDKKIPLNLDLQRELVDRLAYKVANMSDGGFTQKFNKAVEDIRKEYDIETLVAQNPAQQTAIRNRYQDRFLEASYALGVSVPYVLDEKILGDTVAQGLRTPAGANQETLDMLRKEVEAKISSLGLTAGFAEPFEFQEDAEDTEEKNKGGEFDTIHINPLEGLTREFRSLFGMIPYIQKDEELGITINRTADGNMLFNALMKVSSDKPLDQILPTLDKTVRMMEEDRDPKTAPLKAMAAFLRSQFGISDLSDPAAVPTRNLHLYKQFQDTFFVTELPNYIVKLKRQGTPEAEIFDASINQDQAQRKEAIKVHYEREFRKLRKDSQKAKFRQDFKELQSFINSSVLTNINSAPIMNDRKAVNKMVDRAKELMDRVNIILPRNVIRQSMLAIYNVEKGFDFKSSATDNIRDIEADQVLMKEGAYLQTDFWTFLGQISEKYYGNIFADTRSETVDVGNEKERIDGLNAILKKATKYIIKYDINSAISVFQNAENKKIYRYTRYTPPILLAQMVREQGVEVITRMYPVLNQWLGDNPLFDGSKENELFLKNLRLSSFGGFREEVEGVSDNGATFGSIDPKSLILSGITSFLNRETIEERNGEETTSITTFRRSRTQEEATTSNFLVTARYQQFTREDGKPNELFMQKLQSILRQEYNRISREWSSREDMSKVRYNLYNENRHPETGEPIKGDSYKLSSGKTVKLRAYQFRMFEHFFDEQKTTEGNAAKRLALKDRLRELAMKGVAFEAAIKEESLGAELETELRTYMDETFNSYFEAVKKYDLVHKDPKKGWNSSFVPQTIKQNFEKPADLEQYGYRGLEHMLMDHHLNVWINKMQVNQIFDGDIATGIKSATEYYKRNKSGVISGNSMKSGYFRTAVVRNIQAIVDDGNLLQNQQDMNTKAKGKGVDIADGQSYHTMNHRIRMMDAWGRVDSRVRELMHEAKFRKLETEKIEELEGKKVVLNTIKTATGGVLEYYKLSEHLINRTDVSYLVIPENLELPDDTSREELEDMLSDLYTQVEILEDRLVANPFSSEAAGLETQIEDLYKQIHQFWEPIRGREKMHYMLNSMEMSGIDQLFDTNASKKTTIVPVSLNGNDITDLKASRSATSGLFKFMQVETSGIHDHITLPTQARQLLTTYINKLQKEEVYKGMSLAQLAKEYSDTLGEISRSAVETLDRALLDDKGEVNVAELFQMMYRGLKSQGTDSNTLKFFEVKDGKPVHDPNLPVIKKLFTNYYFAQFNNAVFSQSVSGRSDILVSSYGYDMLYDTTTGRIIPVAEQLADPNEYLDEDRYKTRALGITTEQRDGKTIYMVEVMIPEPLARNEAEKQLYLEKLNKFFSTRIPTEDKRSMIVCKVVDYIDASYRNSIIVPQLVHILAGSDLDVDKLYSHTFEHYINFDGTPHVYGDYSGYRNKSQGQFVEYLHYMMKNPSTRDQVAAELELMEEKPVVSKEFRKLAPMLGISFDDMNREELKERKQQLNAQQQTLRELKQTIKQDRDILKESYKASRSANDKRKLNTKRNQYAQVLADLEENREQLKALREEIRLVNNTYKMAALVNVLKSKGMPVTSTELTDYLKKNANPVIPALNNRSLQQKIDILSNEKVFRDFYISERSEVEPFRKVAESIGASVEDVVKQNSIYSIMGDVVANDINASNKDGIGISAAFNKFLAFAEKFNLQLKEPIISDIVQAVDRKGNLVEQAVNRQDFLHEDGIRNIGKALGMFADAAKEPIPSVLNLNPTTAGVSNLIVAMTGNLQMGLLINKIPQVEDIVSRYVLSQSAAGGGDGPSLASLIGRKIKDMEASFSESRRLSELYVLDQKGNIADDRVYAIKTITPNKEISKMDKAAIGLSDVGFELYYDDGSLVNEDVATYFLMKKYRDIIVVNNDITALGSILNLIKSQKPEWGKLDKMLSDFEYFMSGQSVFGNSIREIFEGNDEYKPLIEAAAKMSKYSRDILLERSPLFASLNNTLFQGFNNVGRNERAVQNISEQITKFMIIKKVKLDTGRDIESLKGATDARSIARREMLQESYKYFTADYWLKNNTMEADLDYLAETHPGNPFVQFLRVNSRGGLDFIEATTRMKLDKDTTEGILNGYESLQKSKDPRTLSLSRQLFYYLLVRDGLGYGSFTFLSYLSADLPQFKMVSDALNAFQKSMVTQRDFIAKQTKLLRQIQQAGLKPEKEQEQTKKIMKVIYDNYIKLLDDFFGTTERTEKVDWINGILNKIFGWAGNQRYVRDTYDLKSDNPEVKGVLQDLLNNGLFSHIKDVDLDASGVDYMSNAPESFTVNFAYAAKKGLITSLEAKMYPFDITYDRMLNKSIIKFPVLLKSQNGRLFRLQELDGVNVSEMVAYSSLMGFGINRAGAKGVYVEVPVQGTTSMLPFGFSKQDGMALYEATRKQTEEENYLEDLFANGDVSLVEDFSDNKPAGKQVAKTTIANDTELSIEGAEEVTEEELERLAENVRRRKAGLPPLGKDVPAPKPQELNNATEIEITYTPQGKEKQTYIVRGTRIFNKKGDEVFTGDSVDHNKIFANLAVQQGRATVITHKEAKYVVNQKQQIISVATGKIMEWGEENGDRKAILKIAASFFDKKEETINVWAGSNPSNADLSNMAIRRFSLDGVQYNSVEQAFQAAKVYVTKQTPEDEAVYQQIMKEQNPFKVKALGRKFKTFDSKEWDEVSAFTMKMYIRNSFEQNPAALQKLLATGSAVITHEGGAKDRWTTEFPRMLMEVREELRNLPAQSTTLGAGITAQEISDIYELRKQNPKAKPMTLDAFIQYAKEYISEVEEMLDKEDILDQLKCV